MNDKFPDRDPLSHEAPSIGMKWTFGLLVDPDKTFFAIPKKSHALFVEEAKKYHVLARDVFVSEGTQWLTVTCPHCQKEWFTYDTGPCSHRTAQGCGKPMWIDVPDEDPF